MSRKNSVAIATPSLAVRKTVWTFVAAVAIRFCNQAAGVLTGPISVEVATTGRTSAAVAIGQAAAPAAIGQAAVATGPRPVAGVVAMQWAISVPGDKPILKVPAAVPVSAAEAAVVAA